MHFPLSITLLLVAAALHALSGVPGLLLSRCTAAGQRIALALTCVASFLGLVGVALVFMQGTASATLPWYLIGSEPMLLTADGLNAFFLVPVLIVGALGAVYGLGYWPQGAHPGNGRGLRLFWGLVLAGIIILLLARHSVLFLMGWELMALSAFFLVCTEHHLPEVRRAGWVYLVATHTGTLALFALLALLYWVTGSFVLRPLAVDEAGLGTLFLLFVLALLGFGMKAGMMPLHFWLPAAHANAPSHVSALLSGVMLKVGLYGLIRFIGFLPEPPVSWGIVILVAGCIGGVLGIVFAMGQQDLKRLLAYSSVENIGIMLIGFGLAMIGRSQDRPVWIILGLAGCLLHIWNHALFKPLLFFCAGSVIHATGTRQLDSMGGVAARLPRTAIFFMIGAVAICGLPPLNGFVSELIIYLGLFHGVADAKASAWTVAALAAPVLAVIGTLALACFVNAYATVFLGQPRQPQASAGHEAAPSMLLAMSTLAGGCVLIGVLPWLAMPMINQAVQAWDTAVQLRPPVAVGTLLPLPAFMGMGLLLAVASLLMVSWLSRRIKGGNASHRITWSCGFSLPTVRMQYTATSFVQMLNGLSQGVLRTRMHRPRISGLFAEPSRFKTRQDEPVLDRYILPAFLSICAFFGRIRFLQRGLTHQYLLYVGVTVILLLGWTLPVETIFKRLFAR
ncbi:MAG TPA: hydrogenase [Verrucomicrobia bacterium]|nr:hydrogenase [Verrucomicrobiota bacterium]